MQDIYRKIQQEYENNRNAALAEVEKKKKEIYEKEPKILEIDEKIKKAGVFTPAEHSFFVKYVT